MEMNNESLTNAMQKIDKSLPSTEGFEICISTDRDHTIYWQNLRIPFTAENYDSRLGLIEALIHAKAYFD